MFDLDAYCDRQTRDVEVGSYFVVMGAFLSTPESQVKKGRAKIRSAPTKAVNCDTSYPLAQLGLSHAQNSQKVA